MEFTKEELANEEWRDIVGYEGKYQVSSLGRVKSLERITHNNKSSNTSWKTRRVKERILRHGDNPNGYEFVQLSKDGRLHIFYIHRLVANAFIPNPENLPIINHKDQTPKNNKASNLEWCTQKYNVNYADAIDKIRAFLLSDKNPCRGVPRSESFKQKVRKPVIQMDSQGNTIREWDSARSAAIELGLYFSSITATCKNKMKHHGGYKWKYKYDYPHTDPKYRKQIINQ